MFEEEKRTVVGDEQIKVLRHGCKSRKLHPLPSRLLVQRPAAFGLHSLKVPSPLFAIEDILSVVSAKDIFKPCCFVVSDAKSA